MDKYTRIVMGMDRCYTETVEGLLLGSKSGTPSRCPTVVMSPQNSIEFQLRAAARAATNRPWKEPDDFQPSELRVADTKKLEERSLKCDFYYWASRAAPVFCGSYADRCATPITLAIIMDNVGRVKYPAREDRRKEYQALEEELQSRGVRIPDQEKDFVRSRRQYEATREAPWKHQTSVQKEKARPMHPTYGR